MSSSAETSQPRWLRRDQAHRLAALAVALLAAACSPPPPAGSSTAVLASSDEDLQARLIQYKNRLQGDPFSADARLSLGLLLMEMANPRAAETELAKAVELGLDPNLSVPPLARTWNLVGRSKDLLATHRNTVLTKPEAAAELMAELALASAKTGDPKGARELTAQALKLDPKCVPARLVQAQIELSDNQVEAALKSIETALAGTGRLEQAWELKGDVLTMVKGDVAAGRAAYEQSLKVSPRYVPARAKLIMLAFDARNLTEAREQIDQLNRVVPGSPPALYLGARLDMANGDLVAARGKIQQALSEYPKDLRNLILGAEIELKGGSLRAAEEHLANALTIAPALPRVRYLLAQTFLRSGAPEKAEMILEPLVRAKNPDAAALGLTAEAALQAGLTLKSMRLFEQAAAAEPGNPRYRTAVALNRISKGDLNGGFAELESVADTHPSIYADLALLSARLQQGDTKAAISAAERLAQKQPDRALPPLILGRLKLQTQETAAARRYFEKSAELDPAFVPAALALANLDMQAGDFDKARQRFERVLERSPNSLDALIALADVQRQAGEPPDKVTASLESAVRLHPGFTKPRLALVKHLIQSNRTKEALAAAQAAAGQFPEDLNVMDALGRAQMAAGESAQALSTFRRMVTLRPRAPEPLLRMADVYASRNEIDSAIDHYKQALALSPDLLAAKIKLVGLETARKNWREAFYGARSVQAKLPKDPAGFHLEGLVYAAQQQWDPAIAAFKSALQRGPSADVAIELHKTYVRARRNGEASRFATDWQQKHPGDLQFTGHLGEFAALTRDFAAAEAHFRRIAQQEPKNPRALNNLAWALIKQRKPGAVELAKSASEMDPGNANYLDTLASALSSDGRDAEALEVQKLAVEMAPKTPLLRLTLARLAIKSKDVALARQNLDQLSAMGKAFPAQSAVWELRQQLQ